MNITDITDSIRTDTVRVSRHARIRIAQRGLSEEEIYRSALHGEIIEDYPSAFHGPACLVFGLTPNGEPLHSMWGYNENRRTATLVTAYRPDPSLWIDWRIRIR